MRPAHIKGTYETVPGTGEDQRYLYYTLGCKGTHITHWVVKPLYENTRRWLRLQLQVLYPLAVLQKRQLHLYQEHAQSVLTGGIDVWHVAMVLTEGCLVAQQ